MNCILYSHSLILYLLSSLSSSCRPGSGCIGVFLLQLFKAHHSDKSTTIQSDSQLPKSQFTCDDKTFFCDDQSTRQVHPFLIGIDINLAACRATLETGRVNGEGGVVDCIGSSLFQSLRKSSVDLLLFNPVSCFFMRILNDLKLYMIQIAVKMSLDV